MSKLVEMKVNDKIIKIADIKCKYIENVIKCARDCSFIDRVVLFGSCLNESCNEESDVDIAIFGNKTEAQCYRLKAYMDLMNKIHGFDLKQNYDILYFKSGKEYKDNIFADIKEGVVLYERNDAVNGSKSTSAHVSQRGQMCFLSIANYQGIYGSHT